jgi:hexosaminidase
MSKSDLLIPVQKVHRGRGRLVWPKLITMASTSTVDTLPLQQLAGDLRQQKRRVKLTHNAFGPATLRIQRDRSIEHQEGYQLAIMANEINIIASDDAGAYYAIATLRDLVRVHGRSLPVMEIEDWPLMVRRGVCLDCSRGKVPRLSTLKVLVEQLARWKINELQLYVENVFTFKRHPKIGAGHSPFRPEDILTLQDHCRLHHVRLVGSLASLGHMEHILSLPSYKHLGESPGFRGFAGGTTLCPSDPGSIQLMRELYEEFIPLFAADDFNVCGDEPWELSQTRSKAEVQKVYVDYLKQLHRLCEKHGKRMNLWSDVVLNYPQTLKRLPKDVVMLNWEYEAKGPRIRKTKSIADQGYSQMVCPGTSGWLTHGSRLPNAMENVSNFARAGLRYGCDGLLNTDWGDHGHRNFLGVSLHGFAHGAAHAWNSPKVVDDSFTRNFCHHIFRRDAQGWEKILKTLGQTYLHCSKPIPNQSPLYFSLVEPLLTDDKNAISHIDRTETVGLKKVIRQLEAIRLPDAANELAKFEKVTIKEIALAIEMDLLAAKRALIAKQLRKGNTVGRAERKQLRSRMRQMAQKFETLWRKRNKPSRLRDNLKQFRNGDEELERLIR